MRATGAEVAVTEEERSEFRERKTRHAEALNGLGREHARLTWSLRPADDR